MNPESEEVIRLRRRRRHSLYLVGSAFAAAGITLGTMPVFTATTPDVVARGIALVGAAILATGRFAPDRFLQRFVPPRDPGVSSGP